MKVIIAGSRGFNDYPALCEACDRILSNQSDVEIVSGVIQLLMPLTSVIP